MTEVVLEVNLYYVPRAVCFKKKNLTHINLLLSSELVEIFRPLLHNCDYNTPYHHSGMQLPNHNCYNNY